MKPAGIIPGGAVHRFLELHFVRAEWDVLFQFFSEDRIFLGTKRSIPETWALVVETQGGFS